MNEMNRKSGEPATAGSDQEIKRLAAIIRENRVALDKGWEELARLTHALTVPQRSEPAEGSTNPPCPGTSDAGATGSASFVVVKE